MLPTRTIWKRLRGYVQRMMRNGKWSDAARDMGFVSPVDARLIKALDGVEPVMDEQSGRASADDDIDTAVQRMASAVMAYDGTGEDFGLLSRHALISRLLA